MRKALLLFILFATPAFAQGVAAPPLDLTPYARKTDVPSLAVPTGASSPMGLMYASMCAVVVNSSTPTSTFCPVATDPTSATKRTYPAGSLTVGKAFILNGGGIYTVPTGNLLAADIKINVGASTVMSVTTPAAPVGTNQNVRFMAICAVRTTTTIQCNGSFTFVIAGTGLSADAPFNATGTFDPTVANVVDVTGDWNGTTTTHSTTVTQAVLTALN